MSHIIDLLMIVLMSIPELIIVIATLIILRKNQKIYTWLMLLGSVAMLISVILQTATTTSLAANIKGGLIFSLFEILDKNIMVSRLIFSVGFLMFVIQQIRRSIA